MNWFRFLIVAMGLSAGSVPTALAVVTAPPSELTRVAPPDDPGWSNVGSLHNATGVYLGDRWVVTASHVGAGTITFPGVGSYAPEPGSAFRPANPVGLGYTPEADLVVFRLTEEPPLPPLPLAESTPPLGSSVIVVGHGQDQATAVTHWQVDRQAATWTWTEAATGEYSGYKTLATNGMHWGTNLLEDDELVQHDFDTDIRFRLETGEGDTIALVTEFDDQGGVSDSGQTGADGLPSTVFESQAVLNDSGGGLFYKRGDHWELAGITIAVEGYRNQPDVTRNPMFGDFTYYVDLASYRTQIANHYVYGDFDGNQRLTAADIDALSRAIRGATYDATYDLDRDGQMTSADHNRWVTEVVRTYLGDANLDLVFDTSDLVTVLQAGQYEDVVTGNSTWATGDWTGDGEFTTGDLVAALQDNGFEKGERPKTIDVATRVVPEPSAWWGIVSGIGLLAALGRRRSVARVTAGR